MTDDLKDIDPEIVTKVLGHADAFIDADKRVDEIVGWGESEVNALERQAKEGKKTLDEFKQGTADIQKEVESRLQKLRDDIGARYPAPAESESPADDALEA